MNASGSGGGDQPGEARPLVLVAEDDARLRAMFTSTLDRAGYQVLAASTGAEALSLAAEHAPQIVVLDIEMPQVDGLQVLRGLRREGEVPVILVTGKGEELDRVLGLELGADDYMVKPVYPRELVARVRAVLRRAPPTPRPDTLVFGDLEIDVAAREVRLGGEPVGLTPREFDLLAFLAAHPRRSFTRRKLLEEVWESSPRWQDPSTVTEHVRRIRAKLDVGDHRERSWIVTVRRAGYRFEP